MNIGRAFIIAFLPTLGTVFFLGIAVAMALVQFMIIEPHAFLVAIKYALGYLFLALSLKLVLGAIFGVFVGQTNEALPRSAMLFLAFILIAGGMFLLSPLLSEYVV